MKKNRLPALALAIGIIFTGCTDSGIYVKTEEKTDVVEQNNITKTDTAELHTNEQDYIAKAEKIGLAEEEKFDIKSEFGDEMYGAALTCGDVISNPNEYIGTNIQVRGRIIQKVAHEDERMCNFYMDTFDNEKAYISYFLEENNIPVEEGKYVNVWGVFRGLDDEGVPVIEKVYLYTDDEGGTNFNYSDPEYVNMRNYLEQNTFVSSDGEEIAFPLGEGSFGWMTLKSFAEYDDGDVAYYIPSENGIYYDENGNPPARYRVTLFEDGTVVVFKPHENSQRGVYTESDGEYICYVAETNSNK